MQRIKTSRWPVRNIGGDRSFCKLKYVTSESITIEGDTYIGDNLAFNTGADSPVNAFAAHTIFGIFGNTPNLSTMAALYERYRIRGIKLKTTFWQTGGNTPVFLYMNAQSDQDPTAASSTGPTPAFPPPSIVDTPEQRWAKTRICQNTVAGGRATSLSSYYSVNKVFGPDRVVKNDMQFTGTMAPASPFWDTAGTQFKPTYSPWVQFGVATLSGSVPPTPVTGVLKIEALVYAEFFGKRSITY